MISIDFLIDVLPRIQKFRFSRVLEFCPPRDRDRTRRKGPAQDTGDEHRSYDIGGRRAEVKRAQHSKQEGDGGGPENPPCCDSAER